ncbi:HupE/UreJ family protein [Hyalangium sp.]|uniref:HupE/UreJ family protein n=1 Tax=Hyalangium sp. TaxID=2028555 RepID=UPI002D529398|nr:HupE/UreJ family protein [Hyalangium sp.]HYH96706.1 HupE/UreJ family protein [Hyalangium sp.]
MRPTPHLMVFALLAMLVAPVALAHKPSDSYLFLERGGGGVQGRWDIALKDLDEVLVLDAQGDGAITWGELRARGDEVTRYALERLEVASEGKPCTVTPAGDSPVRVVRHSDGAYAALFLAIACPGTPQELDIRYALLFDRDSQHRGVLRVTGARASETLLFTASRPQLRTSIDAPSAWGGLGTAVLSGVEHIWKGFDHLLFLLALLLPAVLRRSEPSGWEPVPAFAPALSDVVKVVSAFTVAHSLTLSAASLGWVFLPSRLVESAIAASVVIAALNNLFPLVRGTRWAAAFALGLLHGFGFASVLAEAGLSSGSLAVTLLGFNLGVELGQLACVAVFLPFAYSLRASFLYRRVLFVGGSVVVALLGCTWLAERALDLQLWPV